MRTDPTHSTIPARVRGLLPEPCARLARVNAMAWESTDPALLELCRRLVVRLLQPEADAQAAGQGAPPVDAAKLAALDHRSSSNAFSALERAALDYTEQYVMAVSAISDRQVQALRTHLGDAALYAFAAALYVIEMTERLRLMSGAVLGETAASG